MSEPRQRKVTAMGMASLVATGRHEVLDRLSSDISTMWLDVFAELREATTSDEKSVNRRIKYILTNAHIFASPSLVLYWDKPTDSYFDGSEGTAEYNRMKAVSIESNMWRATLIRPLDLRKRYGQDNSPHQLRSTMLAAGRGSLRWSSRSSGKVPR